MHAQSKLPRLKAHTHLDMLGLRVLGDVVQCFLRDAVKSDFLFLRQRVVTGLAIDEQLDIQVMPATRAVGELLEQFVHIRLTEPILVEFQQQRAAVQRARRDLAGKFAPDSSALFRAFSPTSAGATARSGWTKTKSGSPHRADRAPAAAVLQAPPDPMPAGTNAHFPVQ